VDGDKWFSSSLLLSRYILFLISSLLMTLPVCRDVQAVEPGSGRVRLLQGLQNTGAGFPRYEYLGLGFDLEQPTLNWGRWQTTFLGLGNQWGQQTQLGYAFTGVTNLWLFDSLEGDFGLGDAPLQVGVSSFPFEHFVVPQQNFRGLGTLLRGDDFAMGVHAGNLTLMSFTFYEAFVRSDTDLAGVNLRLGSPNRPHLGLGFQGFSDSLGKRTLSNIDLNYPLGDPEAKILAWFDSRSGHTAGVVGIRRGKGPAQWEVGASTVPYGFVYLSNNATLASGQTLGFFSYRHAGLKRDYFVEGSAGKLSYGNQKGWLARGTVGGGWRHRLRDSLGGSLGVSYQWGGNQQQQLHLLPNLRYNRSRGPITSYAQIYSDFYTARLVTQGGSTVFQAQPLGVLPESQQTSVFRNSAEIGFLYSPPAASRWGGSIRLEDTQTRGGLSSSYRAATGQVQLSTHLPYDIYMDVNIRSGLTFSQGSTSGLHSAGLRFNFSLFEGWVFFISGNFYYSHFPQEITFFSAVPNPAYEVRSGAERRFFWGEAAPVYGSFPPGGFKGVAVLSGQVFEDRNRNGIFDADDVPIKDAVLRLDDGYIVETDDRGRYHYPHVADGEHTFELDADSYPVRLTANSPEGMTIKLSPREKKRIDWPLTAK
jgi:hypothetical protein